MKLLSAFCLIATYCFANSAKAGDFYIGYEYLIWNAEIGFDLDANSDGLINVGEFFDYEPESEFHVISFDYEHRFDTLSFLLNFKKSIDDSDLEGFYTANGIKIFNEVDDSGDYKRFGIGLGYRPFPSARGGIELIYVDVDFDNPDGGKPSAKVEDIGINLYQDYWLSHKKYTVGLLFGTTITKTEFESSLLDVSQDLESISLALYVEPYIGYDITPDLSLVFKVGYFYQADITDEVASSDAGPSDFGQLEQSFANFELGLSYKF